MTVGGWRVTFSSTAERDLQKLDRSVRKRIAAKLEWFRDNFEHLATVSLGYEFSDFYKLRVGDWRIFYELQSQHRIIRVVYLDRRDKAYKKK